MGGIWYQSTLYCKPLLLACGCLPCFPFPCFISLSHCSGQPATYCWLTPNVPHCSRRSLPEVHRRRLPSALPTGAHASHPPRHCSILLPLSRSLCPAARHRPTTDSHHRTRHLRWRSHMPRPSTVEPSAALPWLPFFLRSLPCL